jgi:hypothetical protein
MNRRCLRWGSLSVALLCFIPQAYGAEPLATGQKGLYEAITSNLIRAAEKMLEQNYSFKPTPEVRSFAQLVGHLADFQYVFCSAAAGEKTR